MNADKLAAELHALADFIAANPELAADAGLHWTFDRLLVSITTRPNPKSILARFLRAGKRADLEVRKSYDGTYGNVDVAFGEFVGLHVYAEREQVCERVVTGTEVVTKTVPDPNVEVPMVEVTETVETVEWRCAPLLAGEPS